jgi:8-oxo-dGTP pyrophosphatase MutT (NUDIX family)
LTGIDDRTLVRHFTATGFVVYDGCVPLHWHTKVRAWLPPGGHVEANEDPVQTVLREVLEETGIAAEVVSTSPAVGLRYPTEVTPPYTIMVEDIHDPSDGYHQHIDMIYFCRPAGPPGPLNEGWQWVSRTDLARQVALSGPLADAEPPPDDVRLLALAALDAIGG